MKTPKNNLIEDFQIFFNINPKATVEYIKYHKEMHDPDEKLFKKIEC